MFLQNVDSKFSEINVKTLKLINENLVAQTLRLSMEPHLSKFRNI